MSMEEMDAAYRADYQLQRELREAARDLKDLLDGHRNRLDRSRLGEEIQSLIESMTFEADRLVAVWD
jgi:hypothetical protein